MNFFKRTFFLILLMGVGAVLSQLATAEMASREVWLLTEAEYIEGLYSWLYTSPDGLRELLIWSPYVEDGNGQVLPTPLDVPVWVNVPTAGATVWGQPNGVLTRMEVYEGEAAIVRPYGFFMPLMAQDGFTNE